MSQRRAERRSSVRHRTAVLVGAGATVVTVVVRRYRRARRSALLWKPPAGEGGRAGPLDVRTLGDTGPPVLLLHGLVASGIYWGSAYDQLADHHRLIVPDLLGFGGSDSSDRGYGPDDHVQALLDCLEALEVREPVTIGAHSLGCLVALRLAATHPQRVTGVIGFGPPLYPDRATARARIGASGPMARLVALPGPVAQVACRWVCRHRRLAARLAMLTHPRLPAPIAADGVKHSWTSYSETMNRMILDAGAAGSLEAIHVPVELVVGEDDHVVDHTFLRHLGEARTGVTVRAWPGQHDLPLVDPERCAATIIDFLHDLEGATSRTGRVDQI